jgi:hypothetical protein
MPGRAIVRTLAILLTMTPADEDLESLEATRSTLTDSELMSAIS